MQIEIIVSTISQAWRTGPADVEALVERAARAALSHVVPQAERMAELGVRLSDDDEIRMLNNQYRGMDKPTNVLSFPGDNELSDPALPPALLGDVVLAHGVVCREAHEQGKSLSDHVSHLTVHGVLHLLGYDHELDHEAEAMETAERHILSTLGIADPYAQATDALAAPSSGNHTDADPASRDGRFPQQKRQQRLCR